MPKLIPRTHNDYAYNSKTAAQVCGVTGDSVLLLMLPIAHNLPLACPGVQGFYFNGGAVVLSQSTRPEEVFRLVARHRVTHIKVVPALLIRLINSEAVTQFDTSSIRYIQSGGQRLQPEVRIRTKELIPSVFVQENFGMSEGLLMFVRPDDPEEDRLETVGRPISPDDEVRLIDDEGNDVPFGEVGEIVRARAVHAARLLRRARAQRQGVHAGRLLLLRRSDAAEPGRQLSGRRPQEGSDQSRRREDQRRRDREPDPTAPRSAERRLRRRCPIPTWASACAPA